MKNKVTAKLAEELLKIIKNSTFYHEILVYENMDNGGLEWYEMLFFWNLNTSSWSFHEGYGSVIIPDENGKEITMEEHQQRLEDESIKCSEEYIIEKLQNLNMDDPNIIIKPKTGDGSLYVKLYYVKN